MLASVCSVQGDKWNRVQPTPPRHLTGACEEQQLAFLSPQLIVVSHTKAGDDKRMPEEEVGARVPLVQC